MNGRSPLHSSCAAKVWPTAQISSRQQRGPCDRPGLDPTAVPKQLAARQRVLLKDLVHGLQIELRGHIHYREIFVVERLDSFRFFGVAMGKVLKHITPGLCVPL